MPTVLYLDSNVSNLTWLQDATRECGFNLKVVTNVHDAVELINESAPEVAFVNTDLEDEHGDVFSLLEDAKFSASAEIFLLNNHLGGASVPSLIHMGGQGSELTSPLDVSHLRDMLHHVAEDMKGDEEFIQTNRCGRMFGSSKPMLKLYRRIRKVAPRSCSVMLTGESGVGKELGAEAIHQLSNRREMPFIPLHCGAISPQLMESELFGHIKGSFTGATRAHTGYFERAHGGTLFLDEVTEMSLEVQVKLLRVLETGRFFKVGGEQEIEVDVRVIAASNRPLMEAVKEGVLREDLYYRLAQFSIRIPALRKRGSDITALAKIFLRNINAEEKTNVHFSDQALEAIQHYSWPGNVRQLRNAVNSAYIMADGVIELDDLPLYVRSNRGEDTNESDDSDGVNLAVGSSLDEAERRLIFATMDHFEGNKQKVAEVLGISLKTLYNRLNQYEKEREVTLKKS